MNHGGFLRIIEATVAVLIIASVLFVFTSRQSAISSDVDLTERAREILQEVAGNSTLRNASLNDDAETLEDFISRRIPELYLDFEVRICDDIGSACGQSSYVEGNIWSAERTISSNLYYLGPKKLRLFIWERQDEV